MFPPTLLLCSSRFLHALRQNRAQSRLLYLLNCPTFQIASWSALIAKLWQQPTTIFALLSPFCLFILVRAIFKRHRNDLRDRSGDQIRRGRCRKSLGVSPALDEVWGESLGPDLPRYCDYLSCEKKHPQLSFSHGFFYTGYSRQ